MLKIGWSVDFSKATNQSDQMMDLKVAQFLKSFQNTPKSHEIFGLLLKENLSQNFHKSPNLVTLDMFYSKKVL